jgi:hypothetical protein
LYSEYNVHENVCIDVEIVDRCIRKMKLGRAAGWDEIDVEHLLYAHPILVTLLSTMFNAIVSSGYVPQLLCRGIIIPLIKDKYGHSSDINNYRGITLSSAIAKLFEMCLMEVFTDHLYSSELQFGFKKNLSCSDSSHAVYAVRSVCEYYSSRNSTVNVGFLDMSKAFDKVDHCALYLKLMNRKTPVELLNVIINWYSRNDAFVRWNGIVSDTFRASCGVRQGGVLSPVLFAVYVDELITKLKDLRLGCFIGEMYYGCVMYAVDLIVMSSSIMLLQRMVDICVAHAENDLNMLFNVKKSAVIRIGPAFRSNCASVMINGNCIGYVKLVRYLGVWIVSGKSFKLSVSESKSAFYKSVNALLTKAKNKFDDIVMLQLITSFCRPLLVYGAECTVYKSSFDNALNHTWNYVFWKLFGVTSSQWVTYVILLVLALCNTTC